MTDGQAENRGVGAGELAKERLATREKREVDARALAQTKLEERARKVEEARLVGVRTSLSTVGNRIAEMQSHLTELQQAHEQVVSSVSEVGKEERQLAQANTVLKDFYSDPKNAPLWEEDKIGSPDELLESPEWGKTVQAEAVKKLRTSVGEKHKEAVGQGRIKGDARRQAREIVAPGNLEASQKLTYKDTVSALEAIIRQLDSERQVLFLQTPEGQEAQKAEIMARILERRGAIDATKRLPRERGSHDRMDYLSAVRDGDIKDSEIYGEEPIKAAVRSYLGEAVDAELALEAKEKGISQLQEAVNTIESLPHRWQAIRPQLKSVQAAKQEAVADLARFLSAEQEGGPLRTYISQYKRDWAHIADMTDLAEKFVDSCSSKNTLGFDIGMMTETTETTLEGIISKQRTLVSLAPGGDLRKIFARTLSGNAYVGYVTELQNPEWAAAILTRQTEYYQDFRKALGGDPREALDELKRTLERRVSIKPPAGGKGSVEAPIVFGEGVVNRLLKGGTWSSIKEGLSMEERKTVEIASRLKNQIAAKIDKDWADVEFSTFQNNATNAIVIEAEEILAQKDAANKMLAKLDVAIAGLSEEMDEMLSLNVRDRLKLNFASKPEGDVFELERKAGEELSAITSRLGEIRKELPVASTGFMGVGNDRKRLETERASLMERKPTAEQKWNRLRAEKGKAERLKEVEAVFFEAQRQGIGLSIPASNSLTLRAFTESMKRQMHFELSPKQSEVYGRYQALVRKKEQTRQQYEKTKSA